MTNLIAFQDDWLSEQAMRSEYFYADLSKT